MKPTVIIGDSAEFGQECAKELSKLGFEAYSEPADGPRLLEAITLKQPRAVILQPGLTGYDITELVVRIRRRGLSPKIIVTATKQEAIIKSRIFEQGIDYFFIRPFSYGVLANRILSILGHQEYISEKPETKLNLKVLVSDILLKLGVPASQNGYRYLRTAILKAFYDESLLNRVMTGLYPEVAKEHNSTVTAVERAMRHSVETAWQRASLETLEKYFGEDLVQRPSSSAFICVISDKLRFKYKIAG